MKRGSLSEGDLGQDSFLDVVANVVGVLIILVMLIGVRGAQTSLPSRETPTPAAPQDEVTTTVSTDEAEQEAQLTEEINRAAHAAFAAERRLLQHATQVRRIAYEIKLQERRRVELAMHEAMIEEDLEKRRQKLSGEKQRQYDVQNKLLLAKLELEKLTKEQLSLLSDPGEVEDVEIIPTPVARQVDELSTHWRLLNGYLCRVPFHELWHEVENDQAAVQRQLSTGQVNLTVGPIDGWRMRLKTEKLENLSAVTGPQVGRLSSRDRFIPNRIYRATSKELGERVDEAMRAGSNSRALLREARKGSSTIVIWVYDDSFDEFRKLKKVLHELQFSVATMNLPVGHPIIASPLGSTPYAQ